MSNREPDSDAGRRGKTPEVLGGTETCWHPKRTAERTLGDSLTGFQKGWKPSFEA
jgi:hypothetical protein